MDGQHGAPDGRRPGSTAEHARLALLFALVLQPALEHLATHHADAPCAAYVDDIMLQGKLEAVRRAFFALKERCTRVGLQVHDAKCHGYSRTRGASQSVGAATGATHALRGLVVADTPLGEDEFVRETAAGKAEEAQCVVATLMTRCSYRHKPSGRYFRVFCSTEWLPAPGGTHCTGGQSCK